MAIVEGHKGGKKGGGKSADDTLRSVARAIVVDAISEGPIAGLVDGARSVYIDRTPLSNIQDSTHQFRRGLPDDAPLQGIAGTEAYQSVGIEVSQALGDQVRTVLDTDLDLVRIHMAVGNLYKVDDKGALKTTDGGWNIDVRPAGGSWQRAVTMELNGEKCTSPVQFQNNIRLSEFGAGPWDIRLAARHPDRTEFKVYETLTWEGMSLVSEGKFTYPNTALVGLNLNSEHVGTSLPTRHYHVRGRRIRVPSNYDPATRVYTGIWDGTFKIAYCNNPAWVYFDIATNKTFGLGNDLPETQTSKWQLYTIGQHCDVRVPSGYKNEQGIDIMEPRYTFNGSILNKMEAVEALRSITAVWRGMGFYSASQFHVTYDSAQDPAHIYGPSNVIDGRFEYSNSSAKARHSVVMVRFNDANDFFEPTVEPVIDDQMVHRFGWKEKTVELTGCSSRSLARRYGRWIIDTEKNETETVTFSVGMDSIHALPGEIIAIADPRRAQVRMSGRIASVANGSNIIMDAAIDPVVNRTGATLYIHRPDGTIFRRTVNVQANLRTINVGAGNATDDLVGCVFVLSAVNVAPREFRIISIDEQEGGATYAITALQFDRTKFARVERGITLEPRPVKVDRTQVGRVRNLTTSSRSYTDGGSIRTDITLNWVPPLDTLVREYVVTVDTPTTRGVPVAVTPMNSATYATTEPGVYTFRVFTVNIAGRRSPPALVEQVVAGSSAIAVGRIEGLVNAVTGRATGGFTGTDVRLRWRNMTAVSDDPTVPLVEQDPAVYAATRIRVYTGTTLLREQQIRGNTYTYAIDMNREDALAAGFPSPRRGLRFEVELIDRQGRVSLPAEIIMANPAPAALTTQVGSAATTINVAWTESSDPDLDGYLVWISTNPTFNPATTNPTAMVKGTSFSRIVAPASTYYVMVAAYDAFGRDGLNYGSRIMIATGIDRFDTDAPAVPTGLALNSSATQLTATWNANTENDFAQYEILIATNGGNEVGFTTQTPRYQWNLPPNTPVTVRLRAVDVAGNRSNYTAIANHTTARDTVPPAVPTGLGVRTGFGTFLLSWNRNTEADFSHYEIYEHATTTNPTAGTEPTYVSPSNTASLTGYADGTTRNFWVRAVDTSANKSAWAARVQGRTASLTELGDPAALPTGLGTSTRLSSDTAFVAATWAAAANAVSYEIGITQASGNEVVFPVGELAYEFVALKGVSYSIRVRGVNSLGRRSDWTAAQVRVAAVDTIAPAAPGTPVLTAGFNTIWAEWPRATESDFSHYEIAASPGGFTAAAAPGNIIGTTRTNSVALAGIPDGETRFVRIRAVDTSNNASNWSAAASRQVVALPDVTITSAKLEGLINATSFAAGIEPVRIISTGPLPTALTTNAIIWGGKFYRWNGTAYTASTAVTDLEGRITAAQIAVGAVRAEQVDAGAITASKLAIGDFSNLVGDNDYQDVAAWSGAMAQSHVTLNTTYGTNVASAKSKGALMIYPPANRGVSTSVTGAWVTCEPDAQFYAQGTIAATDGPISAYIWLQFADKDGVILDSPRSAIKTTLGFEDMPLTATAPANSRQVRYIVTVAANGYANGHVVFSGPVLRRRNGGELIIDGALRARHVAAEEFITLSAQIKDAIITDAHVSNLSAAKLTAGTALAATITVSGEALSSIRGKAAQGAQDPAVRINQGSTVIDPGRIRISGTTTLDDWRGGSDMTEINGGRIATDTISARSIQLIDTSTIIPDANFQDPASWSSHGGAALTFGSDTSPNMGTIGGRRIAATINPAHTTTSQYSGIESSPFPVQRLVEYAIRNMIWTSGLATVRVDISWRDRLNAEISSSAITPSSASGWREVAGTVTAPTNAVAGVYRILIRGDAAVGTNLILARPHVNRLVDQLLIQDRSITGAKLIATEEVITASAQIKDAIITNAHVVDLSAAKLVAGTAMAASITVDGRSLASLNGDYLFDDTSITWPKLSGAGTFYKSNPVMFGVTGGSTQVMNPNGLQWLESNEMIPYDPNKLYRVTFSIRRGDAGTTGGCYLGLHGWNSDRTERVNSAGANTWSNQHWFPEVLNLPQSAVPTGFTEYVCYYKGKVDDPTGANAGAGTVASPRRMHTNVRYVKPAAIFNFNLASGGTTMVLNHCKIEVVGEEAAELVNAGSTQIEPGRIRVTGNTTLADWRKGGDETRIDGGMLSANTVRANALEIGSRNVTLTGIRFEHNDPSANRVSWTGGQVRWVNDNNTPVTSTISANNALWTSGVLYIYWVKGETIFRTTTSQAVAFATNNLILATYQGNIALDADYGRTIIDGAEIRTGTIRAAQLVKTAALITDSAQIGNLVVDTANIANAAIARGKIEDLAVNTLKIADRSVSIQWSANADTLTINAAYAMELVIFALVQVRGAFNTYSSTYRLFRNGGQIDSAAFSVSPYTNPMINALSHSVGAGNHTFRHEYDGSSGDYSRFRTIVIGFYK